MKTFLDKPGVTTGDVNHFANQVGIDALNEVLGVQIQIINATGEFGGIVIAQVLRVQVLKIRAGSDERPARFGHLFAIDGQIAVHIDAGRGSIVGPMQHGWPEQTVEVDDVFANEVVNFALALFVPVFVKVQILAALAQVLKRGHITDGGIQPDVEVFARLAGNFKAEVGRIAGDIPVLQASVQPFGQFVGNLRGDGARASPLSEEVGKV